MTIKIFFLWCWSTWYPTRSPTGRMWYWTPRNIPNGYWNAWIPYLMVNREEAQILKNMLGTVPIKLDIIDTVVIRNTTLSNLSLCCKLLEMYPYILNIHYTLYVLIQTAHVHTPASVGQPVYKSRALNISLSRLYRSYYNDIHLTVDHWELW